ncbi:MAG: ABC transporter ATP-binding protein [Clostridia bacterium]|jgi:osmoprotectant transport system ATP-binding protein
MALIEFRGATKRYGDAVAVDGLELSIEEGSLVALIGPSGSGKTTSLRMINRLVEPDDGDVYYAGRKVKEYRPEVLRRGMGYVIQSVGLFPHLTVADNIATVPRLLGHPWRGIQRRVDELLALVGLDPAAYSGRFPRELSGGEAQRVGVARALAADPPVLLMDEPFGAVDPLQRTKLQDEFLRIQREIRKTVVLVTHDLDEAIRLADMVVLMRDGRIAQAARPAALLAEPANDFVREFTGADRSLKRLSRIQVSAVARPAPSVTVGQLAPVADGSCEAPAYYWVTDEAGRPVGRVGPSFRARVAALPPVVVQSSASLKDILSIMLEDGSPELPVVNEAGLLSGEVAIADIISAPGPGPDPGAVPGQIQTPGAVPASAPVMDKAP